MCKYCEIHENNKRADEPLADGKYEACSIVIYNGVYCIEVYGSGENWSDPIHYCPFCGRELKVEEKTSEMPKKFATVSDYLKSLDTGSWDNPNYEKWRYGIDYYIKHQDMDVQDFVEHIENKFNKKKKN
jgi:hypothetical protein